MTLPAGLGGELVLAASAYRRSRRRWLAARRSGLGASETATILGLNDWTTPLAIWQEKVSTGPVLDEGVGEAAEWGSVLEAPVARMVARRFPDLGKLMPSPGLLRHPEHPWMLATLDRLLVPRGTDGPVSSILEVKTVGDWMYRARWIDGVPPAHILVQTQQQLAVTGLDRAYVAVLVGGQKMPEPYPVDRDDRVIEQLIQYGGAWWDEHVVHGNRPDPLFADRSRLPDLYPGDESLPARVADDDLTRHFGVFMDARRREAEAKAQKEHAAFEVKKRMADALALRDRDGHILATWKPVTSSRVNTKALQAAEPDVATRFTETTTTRTFKPKEIDA